MISTEVGHLGWDAERVKDRLQLYTKHDHSKTGVLAVLRGLYADQIKAGQHPLLSEFETLGYRMSRLRLRVEGEAVFLGQVLANRYRIEQRVAGGGYGAIYRARDLISDQIVAVKAARGSNAEAKKQARAVLEHEAAALRVLSHAGIPRLIDVVEERGSVACVVQEFIRGQTLHELCRKCALEPRRAATIVAWLAETLHFVHRSGFVHRDLSPTNVLVDEADFPHLMDFGLCLRLTGDMGEPNVGGTRNFMALESLLGAAGGGGGRVDIWALGALLYELLTGERLESFGRGSDPSKEHLWDFGHFLSSLMNSELPESFSENIPRELLTVCRGCTSLDADDRYCTAGALAVALRRYLDGVSDPAEDPQIELAEERLLAWRLGARLGSLSSWHHQSHLLMDEILENPNGHREALRWVVTHALGFDIVPYASERADAQLRDREADERKALKYESPEFQARKEDAEAIAARLNAGALLDENETARMNQYIGSVLDFSDSRVDDAVMQHMEAIWRGIALIMRLNDHEKIARDELEWLRAYVDEVKRRVEDARRSSVMLAAISVDEVRTVNLCALWAAKCCDATEAAKYGPQLGSLAWDSGIQEEAKHFFCEIMLHGGEPIGLDQELRRFYRDVDLRLVREIRYESLLD